MQIPSYSLDESFPVLFFSPQSYHSVTLITKNGESNWNPSSDMYRSTSLFFTLISWSKLLLSPLFVPEQPFYKHLTLISLSETVEKKKLDLFTSYFGCIFKYEIYVFSYCVIICVLCYVSNKNLTIRCGAICRGEMSNRDKKWAKLPMGYLIGPNRAAWYDFCYFKNLKFPAFPIFNGSYSQDS